MPSVCSGSGCFRTSRIIGWGFCCRSPAQSFYQTLAREIEQAAHANTSFRITAQIEYAAASTPAAIIEKLKLLASRNQAIALVGPDYPAVTAEVEDLKARGVPVFSNPV